jgi:hypothetical protein
LSFTAAKVIKVIEKTIKRFPMDGISNGRFFVTFHTTREQPFEMHAFSKNICIIRLNKLHLQRFL